VIIHDFRELLAATQSTTRDELDQLLYARCQLDPSVRDVSDTGLIIGIRDSGVALTFPFTPEEFWHAIHDFDVQVQRRIEETVGREDFS
jgi:hypothetical protein